MKEVGWSETEKKNIWRIFQRARGRQSDRKDQEHENIRKNWEAI